MHPKTTAWLAGRTVGSSGCTPGAASAAPTVTAVQASRRTSSVTPT